MTPGRRVVSLAVNGAWQPVSEGPGGPRADFVARVRHFACDSPAGTRLYGPWETYAEARAFAASLPRILGPDGNPRAGVALRVAPYWHVASFGKLESVK